MEVKKKTGIMAKLSRILRKDGSFLLEAMLGTGILSIVLVFFASISVSAFLLMQKAYFETQVSEDTFVKVEGRRYSELATDKSSTRIASSGAGGVSFEMAALDDTASYVTYVAADGSNGSLDSSKVYHFSSNVFGKDLFAFRYQGTQGNYTSTFYILKGDK